MNFISIAIHIKLSDSLIFVIAGIKNAFEGGEEHIAGVTKGVIHPS